MQPMSSATSSDRPQKRHALLTRLWHWINAACLIILFMTGLNIFNAHPRLYWGHAGFAKADAWLVLDKFPGWITIPSHYSLADARLWHFLLAWPFAVALTLFLIGSLINGHMLRDIVLRRHEWRPSMIAADIRAHLKLDFSQHGGQFNILQKLSYGPVIFILLPGMILSGLTMSPQMDAAWPWLVDLFGGRQSARSWHFIFAWTLTAFFVLHIVLVLLSGPIRQVRDMITGGRRDAA